MQKSLHKPRRPKAPYELNYYIDPNQGERKIEVKPFVHYNVCPWVEEEQLAHYKTKKRAGLLDTQYHRVMMDEEFDIHLGKESVYNHNRRFHFAMPLKNILEYPSNTLVVGLNRTGDILWRGTIKELLKTVINKSEHKSS